MLSELVRRVSPRRGPLCPFHNLSVRESNNRQHPTRGPAAPRGHAEAAKAALHWTPDRWSTVRRSPTASIR
jgi:hypothetical protein